MCQQQSSETQAIMRNVLLKIHHFAEVLGVDTFTGFSSSSTSVTALMATVQQQLVSRPSLGSVSTEELSRSLLRGATSQLLQIAKPHKMLQHRFAGCGLPNDYLSFFINKQQHFSFKAWLSDTLLNGVPDMSQCLPVSAEAPTQLYSASKKWVVSTNTCASIEMLPQGDLHSCVHQPNADVQATYIWLLHCFVSQFMARQNECMLS